MKFLTKYLPFAILFLLMTPVLVFAQNGDPLATPDALATWLTAVGLPLVQTYISSWLGVFLTAKVKPIAEKWGVPTDVRNAARKWVLTLLGSGISVAGFFVIEQFTHWTAGLGPAQWAYAVGVIGLTYKIYKDTHGPIALPMPPVIELNALSNVASGLDTEPTSYSQSFSKK